MAIDLSDGFAAEPDRRRASAMKIAALGVVGSGFAITLIFVGLAVGYRQPAFLVGGLGYLVLMAATDWILWRAIKPPVLKGDSTFVTYVAAFKTTRVQRAELSMIFKGQTAATRVSSWLRSYLFAVSDGEVAFAVPAIWFQETDIADFARRLDLPLRGDFSQRIHAGQKVNSNLAEGEGFEPPIGLHL